MKKLKRSLKTSFIDLYDAFYNMVEKILKTEKLIEHSKVQHFSALEEAIFLFHVLQYFIYLQLRGKMKKKNNFLKEKSALKIFF